MCSFILVIFRELLSLYDNNSAQKITESGKFRIEQYDYSVQ